jgi:cytochrome c-type biogenesis protein CcmE
MSFLKLDEDIVLFMTPAEAKEQAPELVEKTIRVGGMVKPGTVDWQADTLSLSFIVSDLKSVDIAVLHSGVPPDLFKEGAGVVVEGKLASDGASMKSTLLMVKHSEEYKKPDATHSLDRTLLEQSLFKE